MFQRNLKKIVTHSRCKTDRFLVSVFIDRQGRFSSYACWWWSCRQRKHQCKTFRYDLILMADEWGLKLFRNNFETQSFKSWLWKIDIYQIEWRPSFHSSLFIWLFSTRFEIRLQFKNFDSMEMFLKQCLGLRIIELRSSSSFDDRSLDKDYNYQKTHRRSKTSNFNWIHSTLKMFTKFFQTIVAKIKPSSLFYEPIHSPFEQISF